jgi:hypothetical protein
VASISRRFFELFDEFLTLFGLSFRSGTSRVLIRETGFFQRPPTARARIFDVERVTEVLLEKRRRLRRRVTARFGRGFV